MIKSGRIGFVFYTFLLTMVCLSAATIYAQGNKPQEREFCSNNNSWGDRAGYRELRESSIARGNLLTVDGRQNGGISVKGSDRSDILIRACVQAWGTTEAAARELAKNVRIETGGSVIRAEGIDGQSNMSVSYQILVPRSINLKLTAHNGGIAVSGVEGSVEFSTMNGGVSLAEVAGDVRGRTTNGGVAVKLAGNRWQGKGLDVETTNGGVNLVMPQNYAAHLETRTVNGGFKSDFELSVKMREWTRGVNISTDLNGGGAPIRVVTTNGGVRISSASSIQ